jgi:hypothetical protein
MGRSKGRWAPESETLIGTHHQTISEYVRIDLPATNRIRKAPRISPADAESQRDLTSNDLYHDLRIETIHLAIVTWIVPEI